MADETRVENGQGVENTPNNTGIEGTRDQNKDEKNVEIQEFGYKEFKGTVDKILSRPNVQNMLNSAQISIDESTLRQIFEHTKLAENDTLDTFAARCVHTAVIFGVQDKFKKQVVDPKAKESKDTERTEIDENSSTIMLDKIANSIRNFHMPDEPGKKVDNKEIYGLSADELLEIIINQKGIITPNKDGSLQYTEISGGQQKSLLDYLAKINSRLLESFEVMGIDTTLITRHESFAPMGSKPKNPTQTEPEKDSEQEETKEPEIKTLTDEEKKNAPSKPSKNEKIGPNGEKISYEKFRGIVEAFVKDPKTAEYFKNIGLTTDQLASLAFDGAELLKGEDEALFAERVLKSYIGRDIVEKETDGTLQETKLKYQPEPTLEFEEREKLAGDGDKRASNPLLKGMKDVLTFPIEVIKQILTGKSEAERKAEFELVNRKGVPIELDDRSRLKLAKMLNDMDNAFTKVASQIREEDKGEKGENKNPDQNSNPNPNSKDDTAQKPPKSEEPKVSPEDAVYQQKVDALMKQFDSMDLTDTQAVLLWVKAVGDTAMHMKSNPKIDVAKIESKFKAANIDISQKSLEQHSDDLGNLEEATTWAVIAGANQIVNTSRVDENVINKITDIQTKEVIEAEGVKQPLPDTVKFVKKLTQDTIEHGYGNAEGAAIVQELDDQMHPEKAAERRAAEEQARQEEIDEDGEHVLGPQRRGYLGNR